MFPPVVKNLLIINGIMFLATFLLQNRDISLIGELGMFYVGSPFFEPYQIVTHMFMHGGIAHIALNMFALWMFGSALENSWGSKRFLIFYLVCGLGAAVLHQFVQGLEVNAAAGSFFPDVSDGVTSEKVFFTMSVPTVGASGAVYGILAGFALLFPNTLLYLYFAIPIKAKYAIAGFVLIELYLGFQNSPGDNVAHFAHLGGALVGFILIKIWQRNRKRFY